MLRKSSQVSSLSCPPRQILKVATTVRTDRPIAIIAAVAVITFSNGAVAQSAQDGTPTACQMRLSRDRAVFKPLGELSGPGECGGPDIIHLERIVLSDRAEVAVEPPATLRCEMAEDVVSFVRQDLAPAAAVMGSALSAIENYDSYDCRSRNRLAGAKLSEHGFASALDIRSIRLTDGRVVRPTDPGAPWEFRLAMKAAACNRFTRCSVPARMDITRIISISITSSGAADIGCANGICAMRRRPTRCSRLRRPLAQVPRRHHFLYRCLGRARSQPPARALQACPTKAAPDECAQQSRGPRHRNAGPSLYQSGDIPRRGPARHRARQWRLRLRYRR